MDNQELTEWLYTNGGSVIRYLTAENLLESFPKSELNRLKIKLEDSHQVLTWLSRLKPNTSFTGIHNGDMYAFENVVGKLLHLGLRAGYPKLDRKTESFRNWLKKSTNSTPREPFALFTQNIVASLLFAIGYTDKFIGNCIAERLQLLYEFTKKKNYNLYADKSEFKGIPRSFINRPLIKPELYNQNRASILWIHDLPFLTALYKNKKDNITPIKIETIIQYILNLKYQKLPEGYGIVKHGKRYYAMGWDIKLPGYCEQKMPNHQVGYFIKRLELMARFKPVLNNRWVRRSLKHLEKFRTDIGTYLLPGKFLPEKKSGYFVLGSYMGLEENRRTKPALELESTYWILRIKKLAGIDK